MTYKTETDSATIKTAGPHKVQRVSDGGKGDTPRPVKWRRWDVGYIRTFVLPRDLPIALGHSTWDEAVRWLVDEAPEFVAEAVRRRQRDPKGWMVAYWLGLDEPVVRVMRRKVADEDRLGVESVQVLYPYMLEEAADA